MSSKTRPVSLVAERAVRLLRQRRRDVDSRTLVREVLATTVADEGPAQRILAAAFAGDPRLMHRNGKWSLREPSRAQVRTSPKEEYPEPDRVLLFVRVGPCAPGARSRLQSVSALRLRDDDVVAACGGDTGEGAHSRRLRQTVLELLEGAVPVLHARNATLRALEEWLGEPMAPPISLRALARERVGLPAAHDLEDLVARLGLSWRDTDDPLEIADTLDACLKALRRPGESLVDLRAGQARGVRPIEWSRFAFNRDFLRRIPSVPGTYRFYDEEGRLLYVGKSKNLNRRVGSYFREDGGVRSPRVQKLVDAVHRIEYEAAGSDLEAVLREAELIRREKPSRNVQREVNPRVGRHARLHSILILEPAAQPYVLQAYLIRDGRLVDRVSIGPRGGGLKRIERVLNDRFFSVPIGPTPLAGPDLDVELVVRWLAKNRDRAVALDPTDLGSTREVIERLRWFLAQDSLFDPDGAPIHTR